MPSLNIYISEELAARVRAASTGDYKLKVSQICREALEKALDEKEKPQKRGTGRRVVRVAPKPPEKPKETVEDRMERMRVAVGPTNDWSR